MAKSIRLDAPESRARPSVEARREPLHALGTGRRLWLSQDRRRQARPVADQMVRHRSARRVRNCQAAPCGPACSICVQGFQALQVSCETSLVRLLEWHFALDNAAQARGLVWRMTGESANAILPASLD
jgi:hypothetical protein